MLFVAAPPTPRDAAFARLALERTGPGLVVTDEFGRTSVAGVYAAGDLVTLAPAVVQALATRPAGGGRRHPGPVRRGVTTRPW